jgi:alginate O-acetyltransferase complex protein AlgI
MVFSSLVFLFLFLPAVLAIYVLLANRMLRNLFLVVASLFFYAWGEGVYVAIMLVSIACNYIFGLIIERFRKTGWSTPVMTLALLFNILLLGFFKYANFVVVNLNGLLGLLHFGGVNLPRVHLPIGISFFTFHCMSYLIDVYRGVVTSQKSPEKFALYVSLFPQLIAGPIIRYHDVSDQLSERSVTLDGFVVGIRRFVIGLGKKVLIANTVAMTADQVFSLTPDHLSAGLAWLGVICYTLQIYFDFSGYSDMAIGLGRMFGFHFLENFDYPYISRSVREFWRRWHISLSNWFRDYLYIPLGGNRRSAARTYGNLFIVFFLCGLWHGASWTFVIWGMLHGAFLIIERSPFGKLLDRIWSPIRHLYALSVVIVGWVLFRSETLSQAVNFLSAMLGLADGKGSPFTVSMFMNNELLLALIAGIFGSIPLRSLAAHYFTRLAPVFHWEDRAVFRYALYTGLVLSMTTVFLGSVMLLASGTYNPFIYFRF